ncbi:MAG: DUF4747 family protein [Limnohabitans sp.]|nr:DUF4747 family protein [Limnohabitans sp.]
MTSRTRSIEIRQINIAMHAPHSPRRYVDLFQKTYGLQYVHKRGRSDGYMLGALYDVDSAVEKDELRGEIYRFTNIDPNSPWFNTQTGKPADEDETGRIAIPGHLHPNLDRMPFVFRPKSHRFWYVSKDRKASMGPGVAESFLHSLFERVCIAHNFSPVNVTVVPDKAAVDEVFSIGRLTRLTMVFKRPNDDGSEIERSIKEKMERRRVNRLVEMMTSQEPLGILPDADLVEEAKAASTNGHVESEGYNDIGETIQQSTASKPALYSRSLNEEVETISQLLLRTSNG